MGKKGKEAAGTTKPVTTSSSSSSVESSQVVQDISEQQPAINKWSLHDLKLAVDDCVREVSSCEYAVCDLD